MASVANMQKCAFAGRSLVTRGTAVPRAPARGLRVAAASDRQMWLTGAEAPKHLDGSLPGDFGFDPLGLGTDPDRLKWYVEAEKTNGRWAMMAVAGILFTEATGFAPKWFNVGYEAGQDYPLPALIAIEAVVMGYIETKRLQGFKQTGKSGFLNAHPFDPAGMNSDSMALKEIKNGRLAMIAFVGFSVQALVTREGPLANLGAHMSDPFNVNITTSILKLPETLSQ
uniref:Chlorophyll a-b binding protein, chloroplastic n=1 Tax=Tetraselmis sp. GSL018 TaxID=582737 RepID=A0A061S9W9_9CHLO|eukprot:CAMPEP_0177597432 /NCGR_PEP_ID=MMETSP0419_2-20121207/11704_1 /TAXON_ID=582737 /ORGANISM="Tetraselmis sp., Strain GSL018" /LENGTH=225 /DNA_ID=CAMNT_0019089593 /DNA_START=84 /DNA_END=761 /DNA_ORIENTATION=-